MRRFSHIAPTLQHEPVGARDASQAKESAIQLWGIRSGCCGSISIGSSPFDAASTVPAARLLRADISSASMLACANPDRFIEGAGGGVERDRASGRAARNDNPLNGGRPGVYPPRQALDRPAAPMGSSHRITDSASLLPLSLVEQMSSSVKAMRRFGPVDVEDRHEGCRRAILSSVSFIVCFALQASTGAGQTVGAMTGAINGTVTDSTGAVLPGVTIVISSDALMGTRTTVTNAEGLYRFPALAPGEYTLVFTLDGFKAVRREGIYVGLGFTATVDVELQIATLQEKVIVERNSPVIDKQSTAIATTFDARQLANLPGARSMWAIQAATPAVYVARFDLGASATGPRRPYQRLRDGRLQSADGRRHQRDRHQPDGLHP